MRDLEFNIRGRDQTGPAFDGARRNAKALKGDLDEVGTMFRLNEMAAQAFAVGFSVAGIAEFGRIVQATITRLGDLADLANKVGVGVEDLQRMQYGFGLAGVAAEELDGILSQWSKRIGEAYTEGGKLADVLKANGVSLTDSNGQLRSSVSLMRDYADLIRNAGSDQEQMTLATLAFGRAGGAMVLALQDGAAGMDELMGKADEAGGVIDAELVSRMEELGDEIDSAWHRFTVGAETAIARGVVLIDDMRQGLRKLKSDMDMGRAAAANGAAIGAMVTPEGRKTDRPVVAPNWDDRFGGGTAQPVDPAARRALIEYGRRQLGIGGQRTIIPSDDEDGGKAAKSAKAQADAYGKLVERLRDERDAINLSSTEARINSELRRANVTATSEQGREIANLVRQIDLEKAARKEAEEMMKAQAKAGEYLFDQAGSAIDSLIDGAESASDVMIKLGLDIAKAAAQAALFGTGPLSGVSYVGGLFGGGDSWATTTLSSVIGFRATGGPVDPWGTYVVGEQGPEILRMGGNGGHVTSNDKAFGGGSGGGVLPIHVTVTGATGNAEIQQMVASGVEKGIETFSRYGLPYRMQEIQYNPSVIG